MNYHLVVVRISQGCLEQRSTCVSLATTHSENSIWDGVSDRDHDGSRDQGDTHAHDHGTPQPAVATSMVADTEPQPWPVT